MNKLFLFLTTLMMFILPSCSTFINLGDSEKSGTNFQMTNKRKTIPAIQEIRVIQAIPEK